MLNVSLIVLNSSFIFSSEFQIAPIIHEWTYDAMCHDLLNLDGNKYVHEVNSSSRLFMYSFKVYVLLFNLDTCLGRIVHTDSKQNWWFTWEKACSLRWSWSYLARVSPCTYRSCKSCAYAFLLGLHMQKVISFFFLKSQTSQVSEWLHEKAINFVKENKTAQFDHSRFDNWNCPII